MDPLSGSSSLMVILALLVQNYHLCLSQSISETCATVPTSCDGNAPYRTLDGSCNNLNRCEWGTAKSPYFRILPAKYGPGELLSVSTRGNPLPNARKVSNVLYPDVTTYDICYTLLAMQYGQIIAHDMSLALPNIQNPEASQCCSRDGKLLQNANDPYICNHIPVPKDDPDYKYSNISCFTFFRTLTNKDAGCWDGKEPKEQISQVTHYIDLSLVYGLNKTLSDQLRLYNGGMLRTEERLKQQWPPKGFNIPGFCKVTSSTDSCYQTGDLRANQSPDLTILQIILLRQHNRIANALKLVNPHWSDERLFQEARKINIAQHQYRTYYQWLPTILDHKSLYNNHILYKTTDYVNDYDPDVNPSVSNEFATAAFRFFHTLIAGYLQMINLNGVTDNILRISDWWNRPSILEKDKYSFDKLTRGMSSQYEFGADVYHDKEITNHWSRPVNKPIGVDLKALCIQRNRDHGLASYNDARAFCGYPRAHNFEDFLDVMTPENIEKLESLYVVPEDVDLTVGGSLEALVPGCEVGPIFRCIIIEQFYRTRVGDRMFFENSGIGGFTRAQLKEIRKSGISRLICDNTNVKTIQRNAFQTPNSNNPYVDCNSLLSLPTTNYSAWKEYIYY